jgi:hypothetical protein
LQVIGEELELCSEPTLGSHVGIVNKGSEFVFLKEESGFYIENG